VMEAYYDTASHMYDSDECGFVLANDNSTVASIDQMQKDPLLTIQSSSYG